MVNCLFIFICVNTALSIFFVSDSLFSWENHKNLFLSFFIQIISLTTLIFLGARLSFMKDFIWIAGAAFITTVPVIALHHTSAMLFLFVFPIFISIFCFQYSKVLFGLLCSFISLMVSYMKVEYIANFTIEEMVTVMTYQFTFTFIMCSAVQQNRSLLQHLEQSRKNNEDLLIQNVMMEYMNKTDPLTGLYNHMTFQEYLDKLIEHSRISPFTIHLALLDIDNFKKINDTYGHRAGDFVLKDVSLIIQKHTGPNDFAARYGGEEFAVIFPEKNNHDVFEIVEQIRMDIAAQIHAPLNHTNVSISSGIDHYEPGKGKEDFFQGADRALYTAKRTGKNKTVVYTQEEYTYYIE